MTGYLLPGSLGLLLGLMLRWTGLSSPEGVRSALALRRSYAARSALYAVGCAMLLTALLSWLAVLDVDDVVVTPLHGGVLLGGVIFGVAAGLSGFTPLTAFAGVGGGKPGVSAALEGLCAIAGGVMMALLLPVLAEPLNTLQTLPPHSDATLFRVTLDEPYLLGGGFLGQGVAGALLMLLGACIPSPKMVMIPDEVIAERAAALPAPEAAPEETFVALLPGEETLVVDTAEDVLPEDESQDDAPEEDAGASAEPSDAAADLPEEDASSDGEEAEVQLDDADEAADAPDEPADSEPPSPEEKSGIEKASLREGKAGGAASGE